MDYLPEGNWNFWLMFFLAPDSIAVKNIASTFSEATGVIAPSFYVSMSHQDGLDADSFFFFFPSYLCFTVLIHHLISVQLFIFIKKYGLNKNVTGVDIRLNICSESQGSWQEVPQN